MSTSRSDGKSDGEKNEENAEPAKEKPTAGLCVQGLFKRATSAYKEKQANEKPLSSKVLEGGVDLRTCAHCGAPRCQEDLICTFCKGKL